MTITKSITIDGGESFASILASSTNGIIINDSTPAGSVVTLRNLSINGAGDTPGLNGIRFLDGETLHVENCVIFGFSETGIDVEPAPASAQTFSVFVLDTVIRNCATVANKAGILLKPGLNGTVNASLDGVKLNQNKQTGLRAEVGSNATIRNSVISGNTSNGVLALAAGAPSAAVSIENCVLSGNNPGLQSNGAQATIRCSNVSIFNSGAFGGMITGGGGKYVTFSNNKIDNTAGNDFPGGKLTTVIKQK
ncbi:MAG: right-handed parallel beta-helix repeat-containing protein [Planctomycetales bacterium]|nr:right-handed parallel beta-helix repeat-containing protein [Planctomycetales bacterium]